MRSRFYYLPEIFLGVILLFLMTMCKKDELNKSSQIEIIGAWSSLNEGIAVSGTFNSYCFSEENKGFVMMEDGSFYEIDFDKNFDMVKSNFPVSGHSGGIYYSGIYYDDSFFSASNLNDTLYRYKNGKWSFQDILPIYSSYMGVHYQGLIHSNFIYFLSSVKSFRYDLDLETWEILSSMPVDTRDYPEDPYEVYPGYSIAGTNLNGKAYLLKSEGDIFEYDPSIDKWTFLTQYPGKIMNRVISFSNGNKIYFGLGHIDHSPSYKEYWFDDKLWSFNLQLKRWEEEERFPFEVNYGRFISFFIEGKLYIGQEPLRNYYMLYTFEPS